MNHSKKMRDFGEKLKDEYQLEFADEQRLADELFNLYIEAAEITNQQWQLEPERRETLELINRTFNDLYAGWKLIMEGMLGQGMALLRDTIECANYIKLLEVDTEFKDEWREGKDFFLRDIRRRMKRKGISPPPQDQYYKTFSQTYAHPSKKGTVSHVRDWYPTGLEHRILFLFGSVKDIPRTRFLALTALTLTYVTIYFLWQEMFPIEKTKHASWHDRLAEAIRQLYSLKEKSDQEWEKLLQKQLTNIGKILNDQCEVLELEARELFGKQRGEQGL
jgi:hypothetical protein